MATKAQLAALAKARAARKKKRRQNYRPLKKRQSAEQPDARKTLSRDIILILFQTNTLLRLLWPEKRITLKRGGKMGR